MNPARPDFVDPQVREVADRALVLAATRAAAAVRRAGPRASVSFARAVATVAAVAPGEGGASEDAVRAAWSRLLEAWVGDDEGRLAGPPEAAIEGAATRRGNEAFIAAAIRCREDLSLVFPTPPGAPPDPARLALVARRARLDRLLGEALAAAGRPEFAVLVGLDRWRREGDALDAVVALKRAGRDDEAFDLARKALDSPTAVRTDALRLLRDRMFPARSKRRSSRYAAEADFLAEPTTASFAAFRAAIQPAQWPVHAARVLGHLQRTRRATTFVFAQYVEMGRLDDADGLATTQAVPPGVLIRGAERVLATKPALAAGWLLLAAYRLADAPDAPSREAAAELLLRVRDLAAETGRAADFRRALALLRSRHADRPGVLRALSRRGL